MMISIRKTVWGRHLVSSSIDQMDSSRVFISRKLFTVCIKGLSHAEGSDLEQEYYDDGYLGVQIKHYPKILLLNMTQNNLIEGVLENLGL
ncbi:hypothetical protein ACHAXS_000837 [Conticribra weissflogii]